MIADVVWPSLYLTESLSAWHCIAISVVIEGVIFWRLARMRWWQALIGTIVANGASTLVGVILLLPLVGLWLEALANYTYNDRLHLGTFNLLTWKLTGLLATLVNTLIESLVMWMCGLSDWTRRFVISVFIANFITVTMAYILLFYFPKTIR